MDATSMVGSPVKVIVLHRHAHDEELFAAYLLKTFGEEFFPGISSVRIEFWSSIPEGKTWQSLLVEEQTLLVGVGFSPFDEHLPGGARIPNECAATLVGKFLNLQGESSLQPFLNFLLERDAHANGSAYDLSGLAKLAWDAEYSTEEVIAVFDFHFYSICHQAIAFRQAILDAKRSRFTTLQRKDGREIKLMCGISNSAEFGKAARSLGMGIVIWANPTSGNITIQTNIKLKLDLSRVMRSIRIAEIKASKYGGPIDHSQLASAGKIDACPNWYWDAVGRAIMNGSKGHAAEPSLLSLAKLAYILKIELGCIDQKAVPKKERAHHPKSFANPELPPSVSLQEPLAMSV